MKLTTTTQVSVDAVMQGNGGPDENRSGGFERGGWARPPKPLLDLVDSRAFPKGATLQVHQPAGRPQSATATAD